MKLSTHSRLAIASACVLAAVAAAATLPASSAAQAAPEEYDLGTLPNAGGDQPPDGAGQAASEIGTSRAGGGTPVLLISVAIIAAVCAGLGAWRLRRSPDDPGPET